jgi:hypothetical protein
LSAWEWVVVRSDAVDATVVHALWKVSKQVFVESYRIFRQSIPVWQAWCR